MLRRALVFLSVVLLATGCSSPERPAPERFVKPVRPNVLVIVTDDQRVETLAEMGSVQRLLVGEGTLFENSFVSTPMCCPSRATFLSGQYAHNHGVKINKGGAAKFAASDAEADSLAVRLDAAGYRTAYAGKYLNGYESRRVPPGWDRWWALMGRGRPYPTYRVNEDGDPREIDAKRVHETDFFAKHVERFVRAEDRGPWFAVLAPKAPHGPAWPPDRYQGKPTRPMPKGPAFNEEDVSDKPRYVAERPRLKGERLEEMERLYQEQQRALMAVDGAVRKLVEALSETGQLDNTYVVYTSDNGLMFGEHRLETKKRVPYEEAIRVPLAIRGPGVPEGQTRAQLVANIDWAPTIADWAGADASGMDGRSLAPLLSEEPPADWRHSLLIEAWEGDLTPVYAGVRTAGGKLYVEYESGRRELYDLSSDPYQLENLLGPDGTADPGELPARLDTLKTCAGDSCREAEGP